MIQISNAAHTWPASLNHIICSKAYAFLNSGTDCLGGASLGSAHDKAIVIKKICYQYKDRHVDKWKRLESSEILLPTDGWLIFLLGCQGNSMEKRISFPNVVLE